MGATQTQMVWHVVLPTALPGILTGVMLAVARAAGETAPLLFTALFSDYWLHAAVHGADGLAGGADLRLLRLALPEPDRDRLGGLARPGRLVLALNIGGTGRLRPIGTSARRTI